MIAPGTAKKIVSVDDLLGEVLRDQQDLSAVERFSQIHDDGTIPDGQAQYALLMPAAPPGPGQQYAFSVDLDRCTSCKACVAACHSLNGLDDHETWRSTGLLIGGTREDPYQQTITTACHHCVEPACMKGCPVEAYEKDKDTGIVRHLDDQCIGCKYCTLTCPYDVPKYNKARGIVRKCDMCTHRLSAGEAPACVQACPNQAIRIEVVEVEDIVERSEAGVFLPGAVGPEISMPTTTYTSAKPLPSNVLPADYHRVRKEDAHLPLVFMLVLTQLSVGTFIWDFLLKIFWDGGVSTFGKAFYSGRSAWIGPDGPGGQHPASRPAAICLSRRTGSTHFLVEPGNTHLRALCGCRHGVCAEFLCGPPACRCRKLAEPSRSRPMGIWTDRALRRGRGVQFGYGITGVTRRPLWRTPLTAFKFFFTALLLGLSLTLLVSVAALAAGSPSAWDTFLHSSGQIMAFLIMGLTGAKLVQEGALLFHLREPFQSPERRAALLMTGALKRYTAWRLATALAGGILVPLYLATAFPGPVAGVTLCALSFFTLVGSELLERFLYFTTSVTKRMPGGAVA